MVIQIANTKTLNREMIFNPKDLVSFRKIHRTDHLVENYRSVIVKVKSLNAFHDKGSGGKKV